MKPFLALLVGLAVLGLNVLMLIAGGRFFPFGTILGCALVCAALFGIVIGEPEDAYGYRPLWFKVGVAASAVLGLLVALALNLFLATGN